MRHFDYRDGVLHAEDVNLAALAEAVGTPFYCYSTATLERHYRVFADAFAETDHLVCYAMKANSNQSVLRTLAKLGAGADVVSGGELKRALAAGIPANKILFSGVGKTEAELRAANAELARAIQSRHEYSPEVQAAVNRFHAAMGELQKETILHVLAMRTVLTPEQAQQFDTRIGEALTDQAP